MWERIRNQVKHIYLFFFVKKVQPKPKRVVRNRGRGKTIKGTLDKLDYHFDLLRASDIGQSQTHWQTRRGLKKMGPYVPPPGIELNNNKIHHDKRPAIIFTAPFERAIHEEDKAAGWLPPSFLYAVKLRRIPPGTQVAKIEGVPYEIGACVTIPGMKNCWLIYYAVIDKEGYAHPLRSKESIVRTLPNKDQYTSHQWAYGQIGEHGYDDPEAWVRFMVHEIFNYWQAKRSMWAISVKKANRRMNFSIEARDTKHYFKDRVRVETPSGRAKPIIHYVEGFTRNNGQQVMPHIRGLRQFKWNGYSVNVLNPELSDGKGLWSESFDIAGYDEDDDHKGNFISLPQGVTMLNELDDKPQLNIAEGKKRAAAFAKRMSANV